MNNWIKFIFPKYQDKSVKDENSFRMIVAKEQSQLPKVEKEKIISFCKEYLNAMGMENVSAIEIDLKKYPIQNEFYTKVKNEYALNDKKDIVWLKFTTEGFLGVVATSK